MGIDFARLKILVVDDNAFMRRVLRVLLHDFGVRDIVEAEDGATGLEAFLTHGPDIVLTDWEMPILDGLEFTRLIRDQNNRLDRYVPVILVTAHSERRRVLAARDAGITEFLLKPISAKALYERIESAVLNPRDFVGTSSYFGPERRHGEAGAYRGPERRGRDEDALAFAPDAMGQAVA